MALLTAFGLLHMLRAYAGAQVPATDPPAVPDAVIELWEQGWTLNADGSTVYHEKQHVRLNGERAFGEFADPRITYNVEADKLEILVARVKRPDGTHRELPGYSHVAVSPDASAGWPTWANIRQHLLVMSGVEPGGIVELEYRITSPPGARPYLAADVRLDHRYPVVQRAVELAVPPDVKPAPVVKGLPAGQSPQVEPAALPKQAGAPAGRRWTFRDLPAMPDEPQAAPWPARCARFMFSTAGTPAEWLAGELGRIRDAAGESELIRKLAAEWTKDLSKPEEKIRAIQEKLAASFTFVEFDPAWRPASPRRAATVLDGSYGTPEEAAAALFALATAAGLPVRLGVLCPDDLWTDEAPQKAFVAAYVLLVDAGHAPQVWEARRGRIVRDGRWSGCTLLSMAAGKLERAALPAWVDADECRCSVAGTVTLASDGNFAGSLSLRTTGLFASSENLRSTDAQKGRIGALLGRVLPNMSIEHFTVRTLSDSEFEVTAQVKSTKPLKKVGAAFALQLAQDGPFLADVPLPLAYGARTNPVRLAGPFDERIELTIQWPAGWQTEAQPIEVAAVSGSWGTVQQDVAPGENRLTLTRHTRVAQRELPAKSFLELRSPLNELRSEAARTLLLRP